MHIPAWQITTWDDVAVGLAEWNACIGELRHLGTSSYADAEEGGLRCGQSLWAAESASGARLGLAWDWREVRHGVVALSDPMMVLSNIVFRDVDGKCVDRFKRILLLNNAIFLLSWQEAARAVHDRRAEAIAA